MMMGKITHHVPLFTFLALKKTERDPPGNLPKVEPNSCVLPHYIES